MESLHKELSPKGFSVLGFPCNQFGAQEPGSAEEIREFVTSKFGVTFPIFEKCDVKGDAKHPVYQQLTAEQNEPNWNFTKYLVGKDGKVIKRFEPKIAPDDAQLREEIEAALNA